MHAETQASEQIYCIPPLLHRCLLILPFIGLLFIAFALWTFLPPVNESFWDSIGCLLAGIAGFAFLTYMYSANKHIKIIVVPDGIIFYGWGYRMYTPWPNVIAVAAIYPFPFPVNNRKVWGLRLHYPYKLGMKIDEGRRQGVAVLETDWWNPAFGMAPYAYILQLNPVLRQKNWEKSELGMAIRFYAPWIFAD